MPILKFNLLENALDSLTQGVRLVLEEKVDSGRLKVSILLCVQAVELIMKERLHREHWALIFRNIEHAGMENAQTVTIEEAKVRLNRIAGVTLDESDIKTIKEINNTRNRIQHYQIEVKYKDVLPRIHSTISFLIKFLSKEFGVDIKTI